MPLMYLPLIMYVGWMEFVLQPLRPDSESDVTRPEIGPDHDAGR